MDRPSSFQAGLLLCAVTISVAIFGLCQAGIHALEELASACRQVPKIAQQEIAATRAAAEQQIGAGLGEIRATRAAVLSETAAARKDLRDAVARLDARALAALGIVEGAVERTDRQVTEIRGDLRAALQQPTEDLRQLASSYSALASEGTRTLHITTPFATGLLAAAKLTAGDWAKMSRTADAAFPALIGDFRRFTGATAGISEDIHSYTQRFLAPRPWTAKLWDGIKLGVYAGARAIP